MRSGPAWRSLADGRGEMAASGCFEPPRWSLTAQLETWTAPAYTDFLTSLANGTASAAAIGDAVGSVLGDASDVRITNHIYVCVSQPAGGGR